MFRLGINVDALCENLFSVAGDYLKKYPTPYKSFFIHTNQHAANNIRAITTNHNYDLKTIITQISNIINNLKPNGILRTAIGDILWECLSKNYQQAANQISDQEYQAAIKTIILTSGYGPRPPTIDKAYQIKIVLELEKPLFNMELTELNHCATT